MNPDIQTAMITKETRLRSIISGMGSAVVAYSGGIDSTLVLKIAYDELKEKAIGITADSASLARRELELARRIAQSVGIEHIIIATNEMQNPNYTSNPRNRCYFCKSELYARLTTIANTRAVSNILNGTNCDDISDYRPGLAAAKEYNVKSPLVEAGFNKEEVRSLAKYLGLGTWNKPASPCLSSRIPYGRPVTDEKLKMIEDAENYVRDNFAVSELRVRHFNSIARIEVDREKVQAMKQNIGKIKERFGNIGFSDTEIIEFKSGSLNHLIIN